MKMDLVEKQKHTDVLEKTYKLFEAELIEQEFQNTHHLELRILCDNLTSLNKRHDRLLERYYRTENGPMQAEIKENLDRYENEILELETNIKKLEEAEVRRRKNVMHFCYAAAGVSHGTGGGTEPPREIDCSETLQTTSPATTFFSAPLSEFDVPPACDASFICIDCRKNPSTHKCRKCKEFVCNICCSVKRGLEMIWWCESCFENESLSNQKQIRAGNYKSDSEE